MDRLSKQSLPKLYDELASWWPVLSAPEEYADEAAVYRDVLLAACAPPPRTVLELGAGGGNNASYLKANFAMTLVDRSRVMSAVSQALNPDCEHIVGDVRSIRLARAFDAVFFHDAIMYMTTEADLLAALRTAFVHVRPGGVALFVPDETRETFRAGTCTGGCDRHDRGLRFLEWTTDPGPHETTYVAEYAYLLREGNQPVRVVHDRHVLGLFPQSTWLRLLREAGFHPRLVVDHQKSPAAQVGVLFLGVRAGA